MGLFSNESPYGRTWLWWRSKPTATVDPNKIHTADTPIKKRVLDAYKADPDRRSTDGNDVCVVRRPDGSMHVLDGKHRVLAARATGRKVRVRIAEDHSAKRPGWWN